MPSIQTALRRAISRAMFKRRQNIHDAPMKEQFAQRCQVLGLNAPWEDYARARAQISCYLVEYFAFELFGKGAELRDSYLTMDRQEEIVNKIGDVYVALAIPGNKVLFDAYFDDFLKREWINPTDCTADQFLAFVKKHGRVIIKPAALYSGKGITLHRYESDRETLKTYDALYGAGVVVEQLLIQHEQMNRLNPNCVNSVRILTYTDRDNVHMLLSTARSAAGEGIVDNFGSGGMSVAVDLQTGVFTADGIDQDFRRIARHPLTGTVLKGFQVPNWDKALEITERAARRAYTLPQCRWVGWDLAFLKDGDVAILEGNWRPGTLAQNTHEKGIYRELLKLSDKL